MVHRLSVSFAPPAVVDELRRKNPREGGHRRYRHHQWPSADIGHPKLLEHLGMVVGVMKLSDTYEESRKNLDRVAPVYVDTAFFGPVPDGRWRSRSPAKSE